MKFGKKQQIYCIDLPKGALSGKGMPDVLDLLARSGFESIDDDPGAMEGSGFVSVLDEDRDIKDDGISFGSVWLAGHRTDTRKADRKAAQVLLNREIRKGAVYDRKARKERLEAIMEGLLRNAVPIPSSQIVIFDPKGDRIFLSAAKEKKAEEMFEKIAAALEMSWSDVVFIEEDGNEGIRAFLEDLWVRSDKGQGLSFEPKSVAGEECVTTSQDSTDLAFGRVNGKKCSSGSLVLDNGAVVDLKDETLHAMRVSLNLENAPEDGGELLGFMAEQLIEAYDAVRGMYEDFRNAPSADATEDFERQARRVLG